jgi:hypothetical protein
MPATAGIQHQQGCQQEHGGQQLHSRRKTGNFSNSKDVRKQNGPQIIMDGKNGREASNSTYDGKAGKTAAARMAATTGASVIVGTPATAKTHAAAGTQ